MIGFEDFKKMDLRIGKILSAEMVEGTEKLVKLKVDTGEERQIVAGIADAYQPDELPGKDIVVLTNLEPKKIRGIESQGMLLAAVVNDKAVLLTPDKGAPEGTKVS